jgi:ectoine hydroxylase-related dioxygenase (phytanoyl-CoA dioxygenase family)
MPLAGVLQAVAASALRAPIEAALGPAPLCNVDQSWIRHGQPAHSWHQDGALHFDFMAHAGQAPPAGALLEMLTCWIALTPCGVDAPGLEWVDCPDLPLQLPAALSAQEVLARHPAQSLIRPELQAGDALLFDGALLHRTHLLPGMAQARTSLELRFFRASAWPARLAEEARLRL